MSLTVVALIVGSSVRRSDEGLTVIVTFTVALLRAFSLSDLGLTE